jgi:hypothetical protein
MSWAEQRKIKREEDHVYSLLGLFGLHMSLNYGEGIRNAFLRLWDEILRKNEDYTVLLWTRPSYINPLAPHYSLTTGRRKDTLEKLDWSRLKLHSLPDFASAIILANYLPHISNIPQGP